MSSDRVARAVLAGGAGLVRDDVPRADGGPGAGLAGHRRGRPHADPARPPARARRSPRSCGASTGSSPTPPPEQGPPHPRALHLAAAGPGGRRREEPAGAAARASASPPSGSALPFTRPTVGMRTGDTPADERRQLVRHPPDILITTPESLYLMLTSAARETLRDVEAVIIDEIHALAATKRGRPPGAHRSSGSRRSCERAAAAHRAVGHAAPARRDRPLPRRFAAPTARRGRSPSSTPACASRSTIEVVVPVEDMGDAGRGRSTSRSAGPARGRARRARSIWPAMHPRLLELVQPHRSTIIFCNARRLAERLATRLNELPPRARPGADRRRRRPTELVKAHHGSLSREQRLIIEDELKRGELQGPRRHQSASSSASTWARSTSSSRSSRRARCQPRPAAHRPGRPPGRRAEPRQDLPEAPRRPARGRGRRRSACTTGSIEHTRYPRNPLDVLAQQIVAMCALDEWPVDDLAALVRRGAPTSPSSPTTCSASVLDLLAGPLPVRRVRRAAAPHRVGPRRRHACAAATARSAWPSRAAAPSPTAACSACSCPTAPGSASSTRRWSTRAGPARRSCSARRTWRIEDITFERVVVTPGAGRAGQDAVLARRPARPAARARPGARRVRARDPGAAAPTRRSTRLRPTHGLDALGGRQPASRYLDEQAEATGAVPDDRTIVVERFRDEIGDWRVCILSPFGAPVHAPWAMAHRAPADRALRHRRRADVERRRHRAAPARGGRRAARSTSCSSTPTRSTSSSSARCRSTSLFAARFRECAARALLLPRRRPDRRTPLWQQRQRAADLLAVAAEVPDVPDPARDHPRVPQRRVRPARAARGARRAAQPRRSASSASTRRRRRRSRSRCCSAGSPSYMYEGDAPLAERRAAALALDRDLLRDLLGAEELRELLDPDVLADARARAAAPRRRPPGPRRRRAARPAAHARRPHRRRARRCAATARAGRGVGRRSCVAERRAIQVGVAGEDARRRRRGRGPAARRARRARSRSACRRRSPTRSTDPLERPRRPLRPHPRPVPRRRRRRAASASPSSASRPRSQRSRPTAGSCAASSGPTASSASGATPTCCASCGAARSPRCAARSSRSSRRARPLPARVARHRRDRGAASTRWSRRSAQLQGAALPASVARDRRAAGARARATGRPTSTSCARRRGRVGRRRRARRRPTGGCGCSSATRSRCCSTPRVERRRAARRRRCTTRSAPTSPSGARRSGPSCSRPRPRRAAYDDAERARRAVGPGVGRRGHQRLARSAAGRCVGAQGAGARRGAGARGRPRPGRLTRLGPPAGAGRWSLVAPLLDAGARRPPRPRTPAALQLLERYGVLTREAALGRGRRGRVRRRVPGAQGARGARAGAPRLLRRRPRRRPVRPARRGRPAARPAASARGRLEPPLVLAATDPAQPYGAALPWPRDRRPPGAGRRRAAWCWPTARPVAYLERGGRSSSRSRPRPATIAGPTPSPPS